MYQLVRGRLDQPLAVDPRTVGGRVLDEAVGPSPQVPPYAKVLVRDLGVLHDELRVVVPADHKRLVTDQVHLSKQRMETHQSAPGLVWRHIVILVFCGRVLVLPGELGQLSQGHMFGKAPPKKNVLGWLGSAAKPC